MSKKKIDTKVGFYGGSFDPFHLGHLNLALEILEKSTLDEIWVSPNSVSPFKSHAPPISSKHRLEMIRRSIEGIDSIKLIELETLQPKCSYTYDTLKILESEGVKLTLIISDDLLPGFKDWKNSKKILDEFDCIVAQKNHTIISKKQLPSWVLKKIENKTIPLRLLEISSSEIRTRIKKNLCCKHLLEAKTLDYIYKYKLYS